MSSVHTKENQMFEKKMIGGGVTAGAAIGALLGGPAGAAVGAAVGGAAGMFMDEDPENPVKETPSEKRLRQQREAQAARDYQARQKYLQQRDYEKRERAAKASLGEGSFWSRLWN